MSPPFALTGRNIDPIISPVRGPGGGYESPWEFMGAAGTTQAIADGAQDANQPVISGGILANDLLYAAIRSSPDISTPTGWTKLFGGNNEAYWRIADATADDEFPIPAGSGSGETGRQVIYAVFRYAGEVPDFYGSSGNDQDIGKPGDMVIANYGDGGGGLLDTLLICSTSRTGVRAEQSPAFSGINIPPIYENGIIPLYSGEWEPTIRRFSYLGLVYMFEEISETHAASTYNWAQFEGSTANTISDSTVSRWDIV